MGKEKEVLERCVASASDTEASYGTSWQLTPGSRCDPVNIYVDERPVVPILFLPGIMGTNLKNLRMKRAVWTPPNNIFSGIATLIEYLGKKPAQRGAELDAADTEVDDTGTIRNSPLREKPQAQRRRHWGEIYSSCYHEFMATLQSRLNRVYSEHLINGRRQFVGNWDKLFRYDPHVLGQTAGKKAGSSPCLSVEELEHILHFRFEVWAGGYNWLQGNESSGEDIHERISEILAFYPESRLAVNKVIVVTHSMGGFVARSLAKKYPGKILGVVHGAMPANGAAETYINMRQGVAGLLGVIIGRNAAEVGAVLARAQGALELLPFAESYVIEPTLHDRWLYFDGTPGKPAGYLPDKSDPYGEIYTSADWYGLLPDFSDETKQEKDDTMKASRRIFNELIDNVREFHDSIRSHYHSNTTAFWGYESALPGMAGVKWRTDSPSLSEKPKIMDTGKGRTFDGTHWRRLDPETRPGDGTVPSSSWEGDLQKPSRVFLHGNDEKAVKGGKTCYGHQDAYKDDRALYVSLFAIVKMVQDIPVP